MDGACGMDGAGGSSNAGEKRSRRRPNPAVDDSCSSNLVVAPAPLPNSRKRRYSSKSRNRLPISGIIKSVVDNELCEPDLDLCDFNYDLEHLPEVLLLEILIRMPVRSIFRFKCVSKHWLSLISHRSFARFYVSRRLNSSSSFRLFYRYIYVSEFREVLKRLRPDVYVSPKFSVLFLSSFEEQQQSDQFKVLAVSNGLVMCGLLGPLIYYVCDPVTRQWVTLPRGRQSALNRHPIFFGEGLVSKINEDNVVTSYKAARVEWLSGESNYLNLETFSSETGMWNGYRLLCPKRIRLLKRGGGPIEFNGVLHWVVHDHGMVAFDPYKDTKRCRLIPFPEGSDSEIAYNYDGLYRLCDQCQGKLRYFEVAPEPSEAICFSMWVLNDYEKGEWLLEFQVTRSDIWSNDENITRCLPTTRFVPLAFHPFNSDVVYLRCVKWSSIVSYNIRARRLDVCCQPIGVVEEVSWRVVFPAVLPMWPTPLPRPARKALRRS